MTELISRSQSAKERWAVRLFLALTIERIMADEVKRNR